MRRHWLLDESITFLNHGSFGAAPGSVLDYQTSLRRRMEREPVRFFVDELPGLGEAARQDLGSFVGAQPDDLAFVPNATTGVNAVLRSLHIEEGDELLITNHGYNACSNAVRFAAERARATVTTVAVPFPLESADEVVDAIVAACGPRTRLAVLDHVTSPTALIFPIRRIVAALAEQGIDTLVDGAHAPGMIDLDVERIGAAYYTGNCHKWMCAPKGAAFLHVRRDLQDGIVPTTISHGANSPRTDVSRFRLLFDWTGTDDPTPFLSIGSAIESIGEMFPGGWPAIRQRNHELALQARDLLCEVLEISPPAPDHMLGSMAAVRLPDTDVPLHPTEHQPLRRRLLDEYGIEVPVPWWPGWPHRLLRISAHLYNEPEEYRRLAHALAESGITNPR